MGLFSRTVLYKAAERIIALRGRENEIFKLVLDNKAVEDLIIDLNTEGQLKEGIDSAGVGLFNTITQRSTYADSDPLGRGGQPYEAFRTGDYWFSFRVEVGQGVITISSDPIKTTGNLFEIYTPKLEGLTEENLQKLITLANELFIDWYRKNILVR